MVSDSVQPHRRKPSRLPCPWDSPGKNTGVDCHFLLQWMKVKSESEVTQSCLTPSNPMDCSLPGSSVHGIFQARILEWVAIAFSELCMSRVQVRFKVLAYRHFTINITTLPLNSFLWCYIINSFMTMHIISPENFQSLHVQGPYLMYIFCSKSNLNTAYPWAHG